jgi:N6-L-threonylcarbamoyladenine synthase
MVTFGLETSCDETAIGILEDGKVLANIVSSQVVHSKFGGVVPELAARNHIKIIVPLTKIALEVAHKKLRNIDLISVTRGPGLIGALLVGLAFAKSLSIALHRPFIGINHLEGHIYALFFGNKKPCYPFLVLLVSGGHTEIVFVKNEFDYKTLGKTVDDACGEAFDKVAKLLGFPYPGGPYIEEAAHRGTMKKVKLPVPKPKGYNFSYAGLKTAVLYYTRDNPEYDRNDIATNFQEVAIEHLAQVTKRAVLATGVKHLGIVGGVSANKRLRERFRSFSREIGVELFIPDIHYCTDNGAMIALAGTRRFKKFGASDLLVDAVSRESLDKISSFHLAKS